MIDINPLNILSELKKNGYFLIEDYFKDKLHLILNEYDRVFGDIPDRVQAYLDVPPNMRLSKPGSYAPGKHLRIQPPAYCYFPKLMSLINTTNMRQIVEGYCGNNCQYMMQIFMSQDYNTAVPREKWNRQNWLHWDPYHSLKIFLYLTDTNEETHSTSFIPGTRKIGRNYREKMSLNNLTGWEGGCRHRLEDWEENPQFTNKDAMRLHVKAGTLLFFDTDSLHCGAPPTSTSPLQLQADLTRKVIVIHNRPHNLVMPFHDQGEI